MTSIDEAQREAVALIDAWNDRTTRRWARVCRGLANRAADRLAAQAITAAADWHTPDPDALLPPAESAQWARDQTQANRDDYAHAVAGTIGTTAVTLGIGFDVRNPLVENVIAKHSGQNIVGITETIRSELMTALQAAHEQGLSVPHAARALRATGVRMSKGRATVIARTELNSINNGASHAAVQVLNQGAAQAGLSAVSKYKRWLATEDARTRADHAHADGQQVGMNGLFDVGGYPMAYPGDPDGPAREVVNCRCTLVYGDELTALGASGRSIMDPVTAAVAEDEDTATGSAWTALLTQEGVDTGEGRKIEKGALSWRTLPLSLMGMTETAGGHDGAVVCGRIDDITKTAGTDTTDVDGSGVFATTAAATEIEGLVKGGFLDGVSVDLAVDEWTMEPPDGYEDDPNYEPFWDDTFVVVKGTIMGATVCPMPAFADAKIVVASAPRAGDPRFMVRLTRRLSISLASGDATSPEGTPANVEFQVPAPGVVRELTGIQASAAMPLLVRPPHEWFHQAEADQPTPITITADGHIYGHAALWGTCHIGLPGCTTPPESRTGYSWFHLGEVDTDGGLVAVGTVTLDTGHASLRANARDATRHYDHTGTQAAHVRALNGKYGIWISGSVKADIDETVLAELRAAKLSGDWRPIDGGLEMVGLLAVNVPGFPVQREEALMASAADGSPRVMALVAAGIPNESRARAAQEAFSDKTDPALGEALRTMRRAAYAAAGRPVTLEALRDAARA